MRGTTGEGDTEEGDIVPGNKNVRWGTEKGDDTVGCLQRGPLAVKKKGEIAVGCYSGGPGPERRGGVGMGGRGIGGSGGDRLLFLAPGE